MRVVTFQRLYTHDTGPVYEADEKVAATVIRSMNEHADGWDPFRVRFGMADGSHVTVSPKRARRAA